MAAEAEPLGNHAVAALHAARSVMSDVRDDPRVDSICRRIELLLSPVTGEESPDQVDEQVVLSKLDDCVVELKKADSTLTRSAALQKARRDHPELARQLGAATRRVPLTDEAGWGRQRDPTLPSATGASAHERLRDAAEAERRRDPSLTSEQAMERARRANPQLERQLAREMRAAA